MILHKQKNIYEYSKIYFKNLEKIINKIDIKKISILSKYLENSRNKNANIFVIGNGGSASNASAMANDLGFDILKKTKKKPFKIISLTDNNAINSAIANDVGFENLFVSQIILGQWTCPMNSQKELKKNFLMLLLFSADQIIQSKLKNKKSFFYRIQQ